MTLIEQNPLVEAPRNDGQNVEAPRSEEVKRWLKRIESAEAKWKDKFDEMRNNMNFVAGYQWDGQEKLTDERYINNLTLRLVNQKVASLYARDPQARVVRRKRLDFQIWDEDQDTLLQAVQTIQMSMQSGMMPPMEALALVHDYEQGRQQQKLIERVCKTAELAYQYQVDCHKPEFKEQMKQLVRRTVICKVGYLKLTVCRDNESPEISTTEQGSDIKDRTARAKLISDRLAAGEIDTTSADAAELQSLLQSIGVSQQRGDEEGAIEYLEFDFPPSTSIIPSEECRSLKEFVAATFVAQKYCVSASLVDEVFNTKVSSTLSLVDGDKVVSDSLDVKADKKVDLYEVFDIRTKTRFFVVKGFKDFVMEPEPVNPAIAGFWPIFALTFNDVEAEEGTKAGIFPPSDVDLLRNAQKEWNRTRDALRDQRNANAPKYVCAEGSINEEDEEALATAKPNTVVKLKSLPPGVEPDKFIKALQMVGIDPSLYDTSPLEKDILLSTGMQEANLGPAPSDVTATVGTIAEQSRLSVVSSNVDDLDSFLARVARAGIEMMLRGMSVETMRYIVGPGAVWPTMGVEEYVNEIQIKVLAASSGRPNKALDISSAQQLTPLLLQAGANPIALVRELVRRLDDQLDVNDFFPVGLPTLATGTASAGPQQQMLSPAQQSTGLQTMPVTATGQ